MYLPDLIGWLKCPSCGYMKKKEDSLITIQEILMGRAKFEELPEELQINGKKLLDALNKFRTIYGKPMIVTSGYRPAAINASAGGAKQSNHMKLLACDFKDTDGSLDQYCLDNPKVLEECGLYQEDPGSTLNWCHLQCTAPASGKRVFKP